MRTPWLTLAAGLVVALAAVAIVWFAVNLQQEPDRWDGLPGVSEGWHCSRVAFDHAACVVGGDSFDCVQIERGHMVCGRPSVRTTCTRIVNVETVASPRAP